MMPSKIIGLTGGSGSGKSVAAKIFEEYGALTIDADKISHQITDSDREVLEKIKEEFSDKVFEDGKLSRKALGRVVFGDGIALKKLNGILHPVIAEKIKSIVENTDKEIVVIDAPLLFAVKELVDLCDETVAVCAPEQERINRIIARDGLTREEAERRISSQVPQDKLAAMADTVITNDGDLDKFRRDIVDYLGK